VLQAALNNAFEFQFLMVRLKVHYLVTHYPRALISIPYGAIKSMCPRHFAPLPNLFQFLMVRLKERMGLG